MRSTSVGRSFFPSSPFLKKYVAAVDRAGTLDSTLCCRRSETEATSGCTRAKGSTCWRSSGSSSTCRAR